MAMASSSDLPSPVLVATTATLATVGVLALARAALWPARPNILPSPLKTGSGLSAASSNSSTSSKTLVYHPDLLPGARDVDTPVSSTLLAALGPSSETLAMHVSPAHVEPCVAFPTRS